MKSTIAVFVILLALAGAVFATPACAEVECSWEIITVDTLTDYKLDPGFNWNFNEWNTPPESFLFDKKRAALADAVFPFEDWMPVDEETALSDQILTGYTIDVWVLDCRQLE